MRGQVNTVSAPELQEQRSFSFESSASSGYDGGLWIDKRKIGFTQLVAARSTFRIKPVAGGA